MKAAAGIRPFAPLRALGVPILLMLALGPSALGQDDLFDKVDESVVAPLGL